MVTLPQYAAFSLIWISFGIYWGSIYAVTDVGEATRKSKFKSYVYLIFFFVPIVVRHVHTPQPIQDMESFIGQ